MSERDEQAALFANEGFYRAFCDRDVAAMRALWAEHAPVACCHPGWGALVGRDAVLESWAAIMENPASPAIVCHDARALMLGEGCVAVICFEEMENGFTLATNLFVREGGAWRMVHHHAGPTAERPRRRRTAPPRAMH